MRNDMGFDWLHYVCEWGAGDCCEKPSSLHVVMWGSEYPCSYITSICREPPLNRDGLCFVSTCLLHFTNIWLQVQECTANKMYQWMIDRPNCTDWKEGNVFKLIHVSSTTSVSVVFAVCQPCRICQCVWVLSVHVGLPLSIRKGWVLLLKGGYSGPPIQSSALGRSNVLSALMNSRCPFSWKRETECEVGGGQRGSSGGYNPQSRPRAVSQPKAVVCQTFSSGGLLLVHLQFSTVWHCGRVSFKKKSDCIYHLHIFITVCCGFVSILCHCRKIPSIELLRVEPLWTTAVI